MQSETSLRLLAGLHQARVLVLGDVMLDRFVYGSADRISPEAPIPVVSVERFTDMPGGAANVARNVASLGAGVELFGVVGDDVASDDLRHQLALSPAIRAHLISDISRPTSVKTRYVADGQQVMRADRESREGISPALVRRLLGDFSAVIDGVDVVILSDYAKGVLTPALIRDAIATATAKGKPVVVDPKALDFEKYRGATVLTPNRLELQRACGEECSSHEQVAQGAHRLLQRRICDMMVVTRGKDGMSVIGSDGSCTHLPTYARQVFDVSGAGDTVVAALSLGMAAGGSVVEAAALANIAAGIVVGKRGTATVTAGEIVAAIPSRSSSSTDPQKIFALQRVQQLVRDWRDQGLKIAFTNGCFDLLHPGHISLLDQARGCADRLVVGLNADVSISRLKGPSRPLQGEVARATVLAAIKSVDAVVIFTEDTPIELIDALEPDVLVKGADYTLDTVVGADLVLSRGGRVVLADLLAGHSTTETVRRAATAFTA